MTPGLLLALALPALAGNTVLEEAEEPAQVRTTLPTSSPADTSACDPWMANQPAAQAFLGSEASQTEAVLDVEEEQEPESRLVDPLPQAPLEIHAWAEAGYMLPVNAPDDRGAYLSLARLQGTIAEDDFDAFIQVGADQGDLKLLDARITWRPSDRVVVRAGQFKTSVSAEYLIPANHMIYIQRSLHMALVTKRAMGAEGGLTVGAKEGFNLGMQAGLFNPVGYAPISGAGELVTGRLLLHTPPGIMLHGSAAAWMHDDDAVAVLGEDAPVYDRHLDAGILYEEHGWTSVIEGAWAQNAVDDTISMGGVASLAHRFPAGEEFDIEPAAAVELLQENEELRDLAQIAINFHHHDWNLVQTLEWEMDIRPEEVGHAFYAQIQAGL